MQRPINSGFLCGKPFSHLYNKLITRVGIKDTGIPDLPTSTEKHSHWSTAQMTRLSVMNDTMKSGCVFSWGKVYLKKYQIINKRKLQCNSKPFDCWCFFQFFQFCENFMPSGNPSFFFYHSPVLKKKQIQKVMFWCMLRRYLYENS